MLKNILSGLVDFIEKNHLFTCKKGFGRAFSKFTPKNLKVYYTISLIQSSNEISLWRVDFDRYVKSYSRPPVFDQGDPNLFKILIIIAQSNFDNNHSIAESRKIHPTTC